MAMYRCGSNSGGGVTPTSITPSNVTPAAMSSGVIYETTAAGYAIASYDSKTPDDTTPPTVASGDIVKMGGAGYLYATLQSGYDYLTNTEQSVGANKQTTLSGLTSGKKYILVACFAAGNEIFDANISTMTNTTGLTKLAGGRDKTFAVSSVYCNWSVYKFTAASTSSLVTMANTSTSAVTKVRFILFESV